MKIWSQDQADHYLESLLETAIERGYLTQKFSWHDLRRTFLTDAYRFFDRMLVLRSAGHSSSAVTDRYLREVREFDKEVFNPDFQEVNAKPEIRHWYNGEIRMGLPPLANVALNLYAKEQAKMDLIKSLDANQLGALLTLLNPIRKIG